MKDESAFPHTYNMASLMSAQSEVVRHGLSKREPFAALAMQGLLSAVYSNKEMLNEFTEAKHSPGGDLFARSYLSGCDAISRNAVSYADALLAELAKERP